MKSVECVVCETGRDDWGEVARVEIRHGGQRVGRMRVSRYDGDVYIAADSERSARLYARLGELVEDPMDEMTYLDQGYGVYILTAWDDED